MRYNILVDVSNPNTSYSKLLQEIQGGTKVLDVGCATGLLGEYLAKEKECQIVGVDNDKELISAARAKGCYIELLQVDLNTADSAFEKYHGYFDYCIFSDVIEHLYRPDLAIDKMKPTVKSDGFMFFSIPNISHGSIKLNLLKNRFIYTEMGLLDKNHIRFFTLENSINLMSEIGLLIVKLERVYQPVSLAEQCINLEEFPSVLVELVMGDLESYVYQYIIKCKVSHASRFSIAMQNNQFLRVTKEDIDELEMYIPSSHRDKANAKKKKKHKKSKCSFFGRSVCFQ